MEEKYIKFYSKFNRRWRKLIRHPKTLRDRGVEHNSELKMLIVRSKKIN